MVVRRVLDAHLVPGPVHPSPRDLPGVKGFPTGDILELFLPGILALLAFASGSSAGFSTIFEFQSGLIERLRVTPASRFAILIGPILSGLMMMTVFDGVVVAVGVGSGSLCTGPDCWCSPCCCGSSPP